MVMIVQNKALVAIGAIDKATLVNLQIDARMPQRRSRKASLLANIASAIAGNAVGVNGDSFLGRAHIAINSSNAAPFPAICPMKMTPAQCLPTKGLHLGAWARHHVLSTMGTRRSLKQQGIETDCNIAVIGRQKG